MAFWIQLAHFSQNAWNVNNPDPPHPSCNPPHPRLAIALYGGVSRSGSKFDPMASGDHGYANVTRTHTDLYRHVILPSGGDVDVFIHSRVPSLDVQATLLRLYRPISARFDPKYEVWAAQYQRRGRKHSIPEKEESRWASIATVLAMVAEVESARDVPYTHIYVTRPDVGMWRDVDLRRYCTSDTFYFNNCFPPFWMSQCQADFHFVMNSALAREFSRIVDHFDTKVAHFTGRQGHLTNDEIKRFVRTLGFKSTGDHVVVQRHEEVLRKGGDLHFRQKYAKLWSV